MSRVASSDEGVSDVVLAGRLRVFPARHTAYLDGFRLKLTNMEFRLLVFLARNPQCVLRRERIAAEVWGADVQGRTIDIHIARLRVQLPPGAIETVVRVGYRFVLGST